MADAGVTRDPGRLPWLEPYRAPTRKPSNRRSGVTAAIGAIGLAAVVTLLTRDMIPLAAPEEPAPQAVAVLPPPADLQPQIVLPPLKDRQEPTAVVQTKPEKLARRSGQRPPRRRISAVPTAAAYREVVEKQSDDPVADVSEAALAIAAVPIPPDPPRPAVNPSARVVRGKTVQLGVYLTAGQAEVAWQRAVRDYTYLVTMPKSIQPISIRSKRFYRLQLGTPSKNYAQQLCSNLKSIGRICTVA